MDATVARRLLTGGALLVFAFGAVLAVMAAQWPRGDLRFTLGMVTAVVAVVLVTILLTTVHRWRRAIVMVPVVAAVEIASLVAIVYVAFVMATATP